MKYLKIDSEDDFDFVERIFNLLVNTEEEFGLDSLSSHEQSIINVWYATGLIQCEGLHGVSTRLDLKKIRDSFDLVGLDKWSSAIDDVEKMKVNYCEGKKGGTIDIDLFRKRYESEMDSIEEVLFSNDDAVTEALTIVIKALDRERCKRPRGGT